MRRSLSATWLIRGLIYLLAFSITFYNIGIPLHWIKINLPLVLVVCLDAILVFKGKFSARDLFFIALFISCSLISAICRHPFLSYFPSLAFTFLLLLPLGAVWGKIDINKEKLLNYLIMGALLSIFFIPFELYFRYMHLYGFSGNELWLNIGGHSVRFYRASSTMLEPSHYTVVLSFIYIITDIAKERGVSVKYFGFFKYCFFITLILCVSLSGFALILLFFILKFFHFVLKFLIKKVRFTFSRRAIFATIGGILLILLINGFSNNLIGKVFTKVHDRVLETKNVIQKQKAEGSSGQRSSFIWVSKIYLTNNKLFNICLGEGFSNYHKWLLDNDKKTGYRTGEVYNLYLAVLLSTGLLGLISFVLMVINFCDINLRQFNENIFLIILLVSFLTHGYLVMYWVWLPILFFKIIKSNS